MMKKIKNWAEIVSNCGKKIHIIIVADDSLLEGKIKRKIQKKTKKTWKEDCRYTKSPWSECDPKTNLRSRTLTLKKGNQTNCEPTKMVQKKCKKACRYDKGTWSECNAQSQMTRNDKLKANSDSNCEQTRQMTKKCKPKGTKPTKGPRRNRQ
nr:unnamed protein product [Callosobruchus chinensis]